MAHGAAACIALTTAVGVFTVYEWFKFRQEMVRTQATEAEIIGTNSVAALTFGDQRAAEETLRAPQADRPVTAAQSIPARGGSSLVMGVIKPGLPSNLRD